MTTFLNKQQAAELLSVSPWTLSQWRRKGALVEGIHYIKLNPRTVRYVKETLENWLLNRNDRQSHDQYCQSFLNHKNTII
jgi:predicted site-specific integrase-resolvase